MKNKITCIFLAVLLHTIHSFGQTNAVMEFNDGTGNFYNYCPSYIQTSSTVRYMYYCKNNTSNQIEDYIFWRKATLSGGTWTWGSQQTALTPSGSGWDDVHVCDPDVKQGSFTAGGHTYSWIMFYLGTDQLDNNHNQVGIALADSPEGPWTKWSANPLITFTGTSNWGVGQPSATSVDGAGRLLLFYSKGDNTDTRVCRRDIDISNLSSPSLGTEYNLFTSGLTSRDNNVTPVVLHNAGFAYDGVTDRMYIIREREPNDVYDPNFVSTQLQVAYTSGSNIWSNSGTWAVDGQVSAYRTSRERNHNGGFLTNQYGVLDGGASNYTVSFTGSYIGTGNLWSYRIFRMDKSGLTTAYPAANSIYQLSPHHATGMRLDVAGGVDANGTNVQIYQSNGASAQKWKLKAVSGGYFELVPQCAVTRRLDVAGGGTTNGTNVQIADSANLSRQQWRIIDKTGVYFELAPKHAPGLRLDVAGGGTTNGTNVQVYETNENYAQQWKFEEPGARPFLNTITQDETMLADKEQVSVYPIPSKQLVNLLYLPQKNGLLKIELSDMQGKRVAGIYNGYVTKGVQQQFQLSKNKLPAGMYIVNFISGAGKFQKKIILQ